MKTFYEFFAGGGMVHAALDSGWECLFANDICPKKAASYATNWGADRLTVGDVNDLTAKDLPEKADLAWASFPCQDLSLAGNGAGLNGQRSGAFWGYWKLISALIAEGRKPTLIALENVCGALTSHGGKDFETLIATLESGGYRVGAMVIDAAHFVPQSRPRLFIVGIANEAVLPDQMISNTPLPGLHPTSVLRAFNSLPPALQARWIWWNVPANKVRLITLEQIVEEEPRGLTWSSEAATLKLLNMMDEINLRKVMQAQASGRIKIGTIYRRTRHGVQRAEVRFDGIAGCLRTPTGGSSRQTLMVVNGAEIKSRLLSSREAARLMGLPDSYILPERYNEAYHLAGDGVVVPVIRHLATTLLSPIIQAQRVVVNKKVA